MIDNNSPDQVGILAPLWSRRAVRGLIRQDGITMPVRSIREYLKRWGYTAKRPCRHTKKQIPKEVRAWLRQNYPAIESRTYREGAEIHWGDESGVGADEHPGCGYARQGQAATMEVPDSHIRVNLISTVTNQGKVQFMTYAETMAAALFIVFLGKLVAGAQRKIFLIVDRLTAHTAEEVQAWVAERQEQIEVFYMPRSAPELNADEFLNNDLKGSVNAAGLPSNNGELRGWIEMFMHELMQLPANVMSYFQYPCTR